MSENKPHKLTVQELQGNGFNKRGFRKWIREEYKKSMMEPFPFESFTGFPVPDAWGVFPHHINPATLVLVVVEVEDTKHLSNEKASAYAKIYSYLDCTDDIDMELWLVDPYGIREPRQVDIFGTWTRSLTTETEGDDACVGATKAAERLDHVRLSMQEIARLAALDNENGDGI